MASTCNIIVDLAWVNDGPNMSPIKICPLVSYRPHICLLMCVTQNSLPITVISLMGPLCGSLLDLAAPSCNNSVMLANWKQNNIVFKPRYELKIITIILLMIHNCDWIPVSHDYRPLWPVFVQCILKYHCLQQSWSFLLYKTGKLRGTERSLMTLMRRNCTYCTVVLQYLCTIASS